ncbi:sugar phosphate isomerase/epimerase family protein [Gracilibacillus alcaliphilus]|uniref:sugar phosphate isomerase/epimerase family protein n=1 Tax=Gracilibacillus alcaliphilus TaxID=1401441 RepID=UPI0019599530|nr:sugar phosphate isomerase/epimerase family protein [Gracilibacillus alcaliphilus]MBM7679193.1 sugar phosphate isomerase/epimerase [Gracilibacillus alcaliphilus]
MQLGIRAHDLAFDQLDQIAETVAAKGVQCVQLALAKSIQYMSTATGSLSPGYAKHIKQTFDKYGVNIAILGCYINMIHPEKQQRDHLLERFKEHLRFARDFGCSIVASETGNVYEKMGYTEDNFTEAAFQQVVKSVRVLTDEAEKWGVIVGIEGGVNHPIHTPEKMKRLLDEIDSSQLQVIFDPANFMSPGNCQDQAAVFQESFALFGDRIVAVHAKDFILEDHKVKMVPVGQGQLRYDLLFAWIKKHKPFIEVLMENTKEPYIDEGRRYLQQMYREA